MSKVERHDGQSKLDAARIVSAVNGLDINHGLLPKLTL